MRKYNASLQIIISSAAFSLLLACDKNGSPSGELQKVYEITTIQLDVLESLPLQLKINAEGNTRTGGWSNPQLVPYEYVMPPADSIYEFDFKAQPPEEIATPAITPINTNYIMDPLPDNLKGVKIFTEQNDMVAMLEQSELIAYFEFKGSGVQDRFVIKLIDKEKINHARNLLAGNTSEMASVMGTIIKSKENYNPNWSYHLAPDSISFFDVAMEVCDATMRSVEEQLDEVGDSFLPGNQWCPWSSQLTKEIDFKKKDDML